MYESECLCLRLHMCLFNACGPAITSLPVLFLPPRVSLYIYVAVCVFFHVPMRAGAFVHACVALQVNGPLHFPPMAVKQGNDL